LKNPAARCEVSEFFTRSPRNKFHGERSFCDSRVLHMDTMKTIEHKGRNIVLLDFVNADTAAVLRKIEEYKEIIA
jgi:hypothetical protein